MKKYLMGTIAIVMAIALNSFTVLHNKTGNATKLAAIFWYKVDSDNKVTSNLGHVERSSLITGTCPDAGSTICARGYTSDPGLANGDVAPTPSTQLINKN